MAGINRGTDDASVRLVFARGGAQDYLLASGRSVTLPADREVVSAVVFAPDCTVLFTATFGGDSDPFTDGGQIHVGPNADEGGITSELAATSGPPATPTTACGDVATPDELEADGF